MLVLPPQTRPADAPLERAHAPSGTAYGLFRRCLRWDFGFSCAFCLVHEADLIAHGVEGTGLTSVEHYALQSTSPEQAGTYANCFYACRFCNGSRSTRAAENGDAHLLDPCAATWASHFQLTNFELRPGDGDASAAYTHSVYDMDDPRKVQMRRDRFEAIEGALHLVSQVPALEAELLKLATGLGPSDAKTLVDAAQELRRQLRCAFDDLARYAPVPRDADRPCSCSILEHALPQFLSDQCRTAP